MDTLVTTRWLADAIGASDLRIVDATLVDAAIGRDVAAEYAAGHIPGAVFMNLAELRDTDSPLPNMLPSRAKFASRMAALGLGDGSRIVLYDDSPWHTAARAWRMLKLFGARAVAILDGGLARWRAEGRPLATGIETYRPRHFTILDGTGSVHDLAAMQATTVPIVDARSAARFSGAEPDPRPGVAPGHIPGATNLPYPRLFAPDGTWLRDDALRKAFAAAGIDPSQPFVATCGSGITAAVLVVGAHLLGTDAALYDGSWSEWGADPATPKAVA